MSLLQHKALRPSLTASPRGFSKTPDIQLPSHRSYQRLRVFSCSLKIIAVGLSWLLLELTCVTRTSKNAVTPRDQNPPFMSSLASGLVVVVLRSNLSLSRGCKRGSTSTFLQILEISKVNSSRMPSCLWATKPPLLHDRVWLTVIRFPHAQRLGKSDSGKL